MVYYIDDERAKAKPSMYIQIAEDGKSSRYNIGRSHGLPADRCVRCGSEPAVGQAIVAIRGRQSVLWEPHCPTCACESLLHNQDEIVLDPLGIDPLTIMQDPVMEGLMADGFSLSIVSKDGTPDPPRLADNTCKIHNAEVKSVSWNRGQEKVYYTCGCCVNNRPDFRRDVG